MVVLHSQLLFMLGLVPNVRGAGKANPEKRQCSGGDGGLPGSARRVGFQTPCGQVAARIERATAGSVQARPGRIRMQWERPR